MNQEFAIESFISFCDDMMIAEEGFKDGVKNIGKTILKGIQFIWGKFLELCRRVKNAAKSFFSKKKKSKKELIKEKDEEIAKLKAQLKSINDENLNNKDLANSSMKLANDTHKQLKSEEDKNKRLTQTIQSLREDIKHLEEEKEKLKNSRSSDDDMNNDLRLLDNIFGNVMSQISTGVRYDFSMVKKLNILLGKALNGEDIKGSKDFYEEEGTEYSEYYSKYSKYFEQFKSGLRTSHFSPSGRIQEAFILTKLKIIDNKAAELDKIRKNLEDFINKADNIKDEANKKVFLSKVNAVYTNWSDDIKRLTALQSVFYELLAKTSTYDRNPRSEGLNEEDKFTKSDFKYFTPMDSYEASKQKEKN